MITIQVTRLGNIIWYKCAQMDFRCVLLVSASNFVLNQILFYVIKWKLALIGFKDIRQTNIIDSIRWNFCDSCEFLNRKKYPQNCFYTTSHVWLRVSSNNIFITIPIEWWMLKWKENISYKSPSLVLIYHII